MSADEKIELGDAGDALDWALDHLDDSFERTDFLESWRLGDVVEWPGYSRWLERQRKGAAEARVNNGPTDAFHLTCPECNAAIDLVPDTRTDPSLEALKEAREAINDGVATLAAIRATCGTDEWTDAATHFENVCLETIQRMNEVKRTRIDSILNIKGGERG